ncbi:MAG: hypothetical protein KGN97_03350 [Bacteroidota bacterium]|nr:hypothetical protein [Bacteroidota bacterium]
MRKTLIIILTLFVANSCGQIKTENKNQEKPTNTIQIDTSIIAVLPLDTTLHWIFNTGKPADLTTDDFFKIETILKKCIDEYNLEQEKQFKEVNDKHPESNLYKKNFFIGLTGYKRQYMASINSKGEKEVWINCFCREWDKLSRTSPVMVKDGGSCYFNLKVNLTTGQYYELLVNGDG